MSLPSISLWFKENTSDKIYKAAVEEAQGGFVVNFAYGRRGGTLNTGTKTQSPVTLDEATHVYDKLVLSKTAKGYKPVGGGDGIGASVVAAVTDRDQRDTGLRPQLLNPISEDEAVFPLIDDDWCAQEKFDGKRMTVRKDETGAVAANKKGLSIGFPTAVQRHLAGLTGNFVVDGECIGETLHVFDLLEDRSGDLRSLPYRERLHRLQELVGPHDGSVRVAETATGKDKGRMLAELKKAGKEGIVFKSLSAEWYAGRPERGGLALKCKFWKSLSAVVSRVTEAKRSVSLALIADGSRIDVGKVTIPPNKDVPSVGDVVEVRYLYAYSAGGSLYQPTYLGVRDDVDVEECLASQRIFKASDED